MLVCRAGLEYWLCESNPNLLHVQTSVHDGMRWVRAAQRHGAGGAESWRHAGTSPCPVHCRTVLSRAAVIDSMGRVHSSSPEGTEVPLILILNFLTSLLVLPELGKLSPSLLCCQAGLMWNKREDQTNSTGLVLLFGCFRNLVKHSVSLLLRQHWGMWFLNVISVVRPFKKLWWLMRQSVKACCSVRGDAVALCCLVSAAKMGQKYQKKV